jgi:GPH family glycoside/pentoside/hexuronide:cation symporter
MPLSVKMICGAPQFSIFSIYMLITVHATIYYESLGAKLSYLAFFTAFARSFDVLTDPLMSWWSDSTRTKWGRRRPFILVGCFAFAFSEFMLLSPGVLAPGLAQTNGIAYWYGAFFVLFYLSDTLCNVPYNAFGPELTEDTVERSNMYFVQNVFGMVGTLIGAAGPPAVASMGISNEWSFCIVALFFGGYFICTQLFLVHSLRERMESQKQKSVPLVTSMNRAFRNQPFSRLIAASFLDSVGWFAVAATMPFYLTYVVRPQDYGAKYPAELWLAIGLGIFFVSAIVATPFWLWCCSKFGKRNTWLAFNAMNGFTNGLFIFVGRGDIMASCIVTALNGMPLGARFLNDSTLADTIDYDEFITGERREAQFTMFISFVPKIVSIPTQAIPIALIAAAGFVPSIKDDDNVSIPQDQPKLVETVISIIYIAFPVVMNIFSFMVKWNYPIKTDAMNRKIAEGIVLHSAGLNAEDPITGKIIPPKGELTNDEIDMGNILDHFSLDDLRRLCKEADTDFLYRALFRRRILGGVILVACIVGVCGTFTLLQDQTLNFIPSMFQIGIGLSMMYLVIVNFRVNAAYTLNQKGIDVEAVRKWRDAIGDVKKKESKHKKTGAVAVLTTLRKAVTRKTGRKVTEGQVGGVSETVQQNELL